MTEHDLTSHTESPRGSDTRKADDIIAAEESPTKKITCHDVGWILWIALFCAALLGLAVAALSQSEQIEHGLKITPTLERTVVVPYDPAYLPRPDRQDLAQDSVDDIHDTKAGADYKAMPVAIEQESTAQEPVPKEPVTPEPVAEETPAAPQIFVPDDAPPQTELPLRIDQQSRAPNFTPIPVALPSKHEAPSQSVAKLQPAQTDFAVPVIAIVIDDMGLDRRHSAQILALSAPITVAYMPYAEQLDQQTSQAWRAGHELMVHMPMEPANLAHNNPGPDALLLKNSTTENLRRLRKNLNAFNGYMGINNHMGSAFTMNRAALTPIMQELKQKGVWFLDSKTDGRSVAGDVAAETGVPFAVRDVFLDNVNSKDYVLRQLHETERVARQKGYAVAIGHPRSGTVQALAEWLPRVMERQIRIVPLSSIIHARFPAAPLPHYARIKDFKVTDRTVSALVQY